MDRTEYINSYVGNIDVGDRVRFINAPIEWVAPVVGIVTAIHHAYSIKFTVACRTGNGKRFQFYNAPLSYLEKVEEVANAG